MLIETKKKKGGKLVLVGGLNVIYILVVFRTCSLQPNNFFISKEVRELDNDCKV